MPTRNYKPEQTANRALEQAGQGGTDRSPQPGRSARRSPPCWRPGAGGGVEPGGKRPPWPADAPRRVVGEEGNIVSPAEGRVRGEAQLRLGAGAGRPSL